MSTPELTVKEKGLLVDVLLKCASLQTSQRRDDVVALLPTAIGAGIDRRGDARADVANILTGCLHHENGLTSLLDALEFYERDSLPFQEINQQVQHILTHREPPPVTPPSAALSPAIPLPVTPPAAPPPVTHLSAATSPVGLPQPAAVPPQAAPPAATPAGQPLPPQNRRGRQFQMGLTWGALAIVALIAFVASRFIPPVSPPLITPTVAVQLDPPQTPLLNPAGETTLPPGKDLFLSASAAGAESYTWTVSGDGSLSSYTGEQTVYYAPQGGQAALVSVVAHNARGDSPPATLAIAISNARGVTLEDAGGIPAGFMNPGSVGVSIVNTGCHSQDTCYELTYKAGDGWGGIMWWPQACGLTGGPEEFQRAMDGVCSVDALAKEKSDVARLKFWARGAQGGEVIEFKVGDNKILPSPERSTGPVTLSADWQPFELDLTGMYMSDVIALFTWVATDEGNPQGAVFYLDDIQFEPNR